MTDSPLTDLERAVLGIERRFYARPGSKAQAILTELGLGETRYHQVLHRLLDTEQALAHDPVTVRRLHRIREHRSTLRRGA